MAKQCRKKGCRKKLPLVPLKCRCQRFFCMSHLSDHPCPVDERALQRETLALALQPATFSKVVAIS
jgi:hypothetical protein